MTVPSVCIVCNRLCLAGQRDRFGRDCHYECQLRCLRPELRDPKLPKFLAGEGSAKEGKNHD